MTADDEKELHRLCDMLRMIDDGLEPGSPLHEATRKAGLALSYGFIHGLWPQIESVYEQLGRPLSDRELDFLGKIPGASA